MKKTAKKLLAGLLTAAVTFGSLGTTAAQAAAGDPKPYEWEQLYLTNRERINLGLQPLSSFPKLTLAAQTRGKEQAVLFGHTRPDGRSWDTILDEKGIARRAWGENVAVGYSSPEQVTTGWMNSEGHRRNILLPAYCHLGVGYTQQAGTTYTHHWAQIFLGGCSFDDFWVYDGDDGEACESDTVFQVEKGTAIEEMNLIGALKCSHGTSVFPLDAALCSGYRPSRADNIAHTVTVKAQGMQTKFKIMVTTPLNKEPAPTLNRKAKGKNAVELKWTKVNGAEKYRIYRRIGKNGKFVQIGTMPTTYFTDKKAPAGKDLYYRVRAVRGTENGKYSAIRSIRLA